MHMSIKGCLLDYIFQKRYITNGDINSLVIPQWLNEYDSIMEQFESMCACDPNFGAVIQALFSSLCETVMENCFEFSYGLECMSLFVSEEDVNNLMEIIWLDAVVGTCIKFMEDVLECVKLWRSQVQVSNQAKKNTLSKKTESKTRPNIPRKARDILEAWFRDNVDSPYPKLHDKERLCMQTGLSMKKIDNWFINERSRKWHLYKRNSCLH